MSKRRSSRSSRSRGNWRPRGRSVSRAQSASSMWCRLVTGEKTEEAEPITWRQATREQAGEAEAPRRLYSDPGSAAARQAALEAEQALHAAYQRGLRDGEAAATQKLAEQVRIKVEQLSRSIEQLALHRTKIQREAEPELVRLALAIAR